MRLAILVVMFTVLLADTVRAASEDVVDLNESTPIQLEDALPQDSLIQLQFSATNGDRTGGNSLQLLPQASMGFRQTIEIGTGLIVQDQAGDWSAQGIHGYVLGQVVREKRTIPALALRADLIGPTADDGLSGEFGIRATKTFGLTRIHLNVSYRAVRSGEDRYLLGVAGDRHLARKLLLVADAYYEGYPSSGSEALGAELGANFSIVSGILLQGAAGVNRFDGENDPRFLIGIAAQR